MDFEIQIGDELVKFNLYEELRIRKGPDFENSVTDHAVIYGYLKTIQSRIIEEFDLAEHRLESTYNRLYKKYKSPINNPYFLKTKKMPTDDLSASLAKSHQSYIKAKENFITAKRAMNDFYGIIRAFEAKKDLIQTLSANQRKEKI